MRIEGRMRIPKVAEAVELAKGAADKDIGVAATAVKSLMAWEEGELVAVGAGKHINIERLIISILCSLGGGRLVWQASKEWHGLHAVPSFEGLRAHACARTWPGRHRLVPIRLGRSSMVNSGLCSGLLLSHSSMFSGLCSGCSVSCCLLHARLGFKQLISLRGSLFVAIMGF